MSSMCFLFFFFVVRCAIGEAYIPPNTMENQNIEYVLNELQKLRNQNIEFERKLNDQETEFERKFNDQEAEFERKLSEQDTTITKLNEKLTNSTLVNTKLQQNTVFETNNSHGTTNSKRQTSTGNIYIHLYLYKCIY